MFKREKKLLFRYSLSFFFSSIIEKDCIIKKLLNNSDRIKFKLTPKIIRSYVFHRDKFNQIER